MQFRYFAQCHRMGSEWEELYTKNSFFIPNYLRPASDIAYFNFAVFFESRFSYSATHGQVLAN